MLSHTCVRLDQSDATTLQKIGAKQFFHPLHRVNEVTRDQTFLILEKEWMDGKVPTCELWVPYIWLEFKGSGGHLPSGVRFVYP